MLKPPFPFPVAPQDIYLRRAKLLRGFIAAYPELAECPVRQIPAEFFSAVWCIGFIRISSKLFFTSTLNIISINIDKSIMKYK